MADENLKKIAKLTTGRSDFQTGFGAPVRSHIFGRPAAPSHEAGPKFTFFESSSSALSNGPSFTLIEPV